MSLLSRIHLFIHKTEGKRKGTLTKPSDEMTGILKSYVLIIIVNEKTVLLTLQILLDKKFWLEGCQSLTNQLLPPLHTTWPPQSRS